MLAIHLFATVTMDNFRNYFENELAAKRKGKKKRSPKPQCDFPHHFQNNLESHVATVGYIQKHSVIGP
jgi:hypothetical protein